MFCSIGRYSDTSLGVEHVGIIVVTHIAFFIFLKTPCILIWSFNNNSVGTILAQKSRRISVVMCCKCTLLFWHFLV